MAEQTVFQPLVIPSDEEIGVAIHVDAAGDPNGNPIIGEGEEKEKETILDISDISDEGDGEETAKTELAVKAKKETTKKGGKTTETPNEVEDISNIEITETTPFWVEYGYKSKEEFDNVIESAKTPQVVTTSLSDSLKGDAHLLNFLANFSGDADSKTDVIIDYFALPKEDKDLFDNVFAASDKEELMKMSDKHLYIRSLVSEGMTFSDAKETYEQQAGGSASERFSLKNQIKSYKQGIEQMEIKSPFATTTPKEEKVGNEEKDGATILREKTAESKITFQSFVPTDFQLEVNAEGKLVRYKPNTNEVKLATDMIALLNPYIDKDTFNQIFPTFVAGVSHNNYTNKLLNLKEKDVAKVVAKGLGQGQQKPIETAVNNEVLSEADELYEQYKKGNPNPLSKGSWRKFNGF